MKFTTLSIFGIIVNFTLDLIYGIRENGEIVARFLEFIPNTCH